NTGWSKFKTSQAASPEKQKKEERNCGGIWWTVLKAGGTTEQTRGHLKPPTSSTRTPARLCG
uniref:Uncharacterized protein n=1 Tax=Aegilops tauschii subsp. strangulata TaxID=200361 RepID=A0A453GMK1_AEGTS